jgi:hypothetical protein
LNLPRRVRHRLPQFADFQFQKLIRHDERLERSAHITAARSNRLVSRHFKPIGIGLWARGIATWKVPD